MTIVIVRIPVHKKNWDYYSIILQVYVNNLGNICNRGKLMSCPNIDLATWHIHNPSVPLNRWPHRRQHCMLLSSIMGWWSWKSSIFSRNIVYLSWLKKIKLEPSIGASHQISVHFGKAVSDKKIFRNWPI
jgi:hypothetical protein